MREGSSWSGREANCAFLNVGDGSFVDVSRTSGLGWIDDGRAFARVDWDHDGDLDLWIVNRTAPQVRFMRNNTPDTARSVAFRLTGRNVNRDAVGSRVEVRAGENEWVRVVQAGTGYLSQSSSWLHFGVGNRDRVEQVLVRWPDGTVQRFSDVETGQRYHVRQGQAVLELVSTLGSRVEVELEPRLQQPIEPTEVANIGLTWRVRIPSVRVTDFDGQEHVIGEGGRPLLVNFWASWCPSCLHELDQWTQERERIEDAGLEILALAVDEAQADVGNAPARAVVEQLGSWFPSGAATDALLLLFELLQSSLVDRHRRLPVPSGFLLDGRGRLARIYKGPVELEKLLADVAELELSNTKASRAALPFPGRWHLGPHFPGMLRLAQGYLDQQATSFAVHFVAEALAVDTAVTPSTRKKTVDLLARAGAQFLDHGRPAEARANLELALSLDDTAARVWFLLGRAQADLGEYPEAAEALERSTELRPGWARAWEMLGLARAGEGDRQRSMAAYTQSARLDPQRAGPWLGMGVQHLTGGEPQPASRAFRRATELNPGDGMAWTGLGTSLCLIGKQGEGLQALERALGIDPSNQRARAQLTACR